MVQAQQGTQLNDNEEVLLYSVMELMDIEIPEVAQGGRTQTVSETTAKLYAEYVRETTAQAIDEGTEFTLYTLDTFNRLVLVAEKEENL